MNTGRVLVLWFCVLVFASASGLGTTDASQLDAKEWGLHNPTNQNTSVTRQVGRSEEGGAPDDQSDVLSQLKHFNDSGGTQNSSVVKSPLGSVDVMVPSLRGMEPPAVNGSPYNKFPSGSQRAGRTDAPMLNYIFDTHSTLNKHTHRNDRFGGPRILTHEKSIAVDTHDKAELDCKVTSLRDKLVSWVRRKPKDNSLDILTIGQQTFTADLRFSVEYLVPDTWRLVIAPTTPEDSGPYECQLSTHPPISSKYHLTVHPPVVEIAEGSKDRYYERNSTLSLGCSVTHYPGAQITWLHHSSTLNDDTTRGGISVKTESRAGGCESTLQVARLGHNDSGIYTCLVSEGLLDSVHVHVLNESLAELHQGSTATSSRPGSLLRIIFCSALLRTLMLCQRAPLSS